MGAHLGAYQHCGLPNKRQRVDHVRVALGDMLGIMQAHHWQTQSLADLHYISALAETLRECVEQLDDKRVTTAKRRAKQQQRQYQLSLAK